MTRNELHAALILQRRINRLQGQLDDLRETGGLLSAAGQIRVRGCSRRAAAELAAELAQEIDELTDKLRVEREIIRRHIDQTPLDEVERRLMLMRYVDCRPWSWVMRRLSYSKSRIFDLHERAVAKIGLRRT